MNFFLNKREKSLTQVQFQCRFQVRFRSVFRIPKTAHTFVIFSNEKNKNIDEQWELRTLIHIDGFEERILVQTTTVTEN